MAHDIVENKRDKKRVIFLYNILVLFVIMRIPSIDYTTHPAYQHERSLGRRYRALRLFMPGFFSALQQRMSVKAGICADGCDLGRNGAVGYHISSEKIAQLRNHAQMYIDWIEQRKQDKAASIFKEKVVQTSEKKSPELYTAVNDILSELGIIRRAEHYKGYALKLVHLAVQVGDPEDSDWRDHFIDAGIKDPPTSYFHIDGSIANMKAVMYLTDVGEENGPFRYVRGSNLPLGIWENAVRYGNDKARLDLCDIEHRKLFASLPRMLQKKSEFGNDMQEGCDELMAKEYHFLSERDGNLILFDPGGMHRGGMVESGKRIILQMNFMPSSKGGMDHKNEGEM